MRAGGVETCGRGWLWPVVADALAELLRYGVSRAHGARRDSPDGGAPALVVQAWAAGRAVMVFGADAEVYGVRGRAVIVTAGARPLFNVPAACWPVAGGDVLAAMMLAPAGAARVTTLGESLEVVEALRSAAATGEAWRRSLSPAGRGPDGAPLLAELNQRASVTREKARAMVPPSHWHFDDGPPAVRLASREAGATCAAMLRAWSPGVGLTVRP
jgi:hypothetical protein